MGSEDSASSTAVAETDAGSTASEEPTTKSSGYSSDTSDQPFPMSTPWMSSTRFSPKPPKILSSKQLVSMLAGPELPPLDLGPGQWGC